MTGVALLVYVEVREVTAANQLLVHLVAYFAEFRESHAAAVTDKTRFVSVLGFAGNQELFGGNVDDLDLAPFDLARNHHIMQGRVAKLRS